LHLTLLSVLMFIFLIATFILISFKTALSCLQRKDTKKILKSLGKQFFYRNLHLHFFPNRGYEGIYFALTCAVTITRFCYILIVAFLMVAIGGLSIESPGELSLSFPNGAVAGLAFFALFLIVGDFLPRLLGTRYPEVVIRRGSVFASCFMLLAIPFAYPFFKLTHSSTRGVYFDHLQEESGTQTQQELFEMIQEADIHTRLDAHDKKLIESVVLFRDRIAREVMVPRVDIFSLPAEISINEAAKLLHSEGYSRIPVYQQSMDNIIGVLMYKDVLTKFMEYEQKGDPKILNTPVQTILKNVLYTPETKKISQLLQDFRKKQVHLAIVVDEYGGTEGIVTIEDILEEIVGDIADEYDKEESLFVPLPDGGWIVDARMNILDLESELNIALPQEGDYDTVAGYIFHYAGEIPSKGFFIKSKDFEIEVLRSTDRCVEKVRINLEKAVEDDKLTQSFEA
jgi:putative hemolysin